MSIQTAEFKSLQKTVFESLGTASMCWDPIPSGVFDSTEAEKVGNKLMEAIESDISNAIKALQKALSEDKSEGSYYYVWQANIAMAFVDEFIKQGDSHEEFTKWLMLENGLSVIANNAAKNFLDLLISRP